jgi:hypothetical protein
MAEVKNDEGWGFPLNSRKAHFFDQSKRSLCGNWAFFGKLENARHDHPINCMACMRKRETRQKITEKK